MFYSFFVEEKYRNFLRLFWYWDNNFSNSFIEYCMKVYVFGNWFFLVEIGVEKYGSGVKDFIKKKFLCGWWIDIFVIIIWSNWFDDVYYVCF